MIEPDEPEPGPSTLGTHPKDSGTTKQPDIQMEQPEPPQLAQMETDNISPERYITPKKTSRLTSLQVPDKVPTTTSNKFEPLANVTQTEIDITNKARTVTRKPATATVPRRPQNPPPFVLEGIPHSHKNFLAEVKPYIKKNFTVKYTALNTIVYTTDKSDNSSFKTALTDVLQHHFHTYTLREDKHHAFVLLGLQGNPETDEIKNELEEEYNISVHNIYKMKTTKAPLYLIVVSRDVTLKQLLQEVKIIQYTRIRWERRRNERLITQCRRCQAWGHATSNCYRALKCVKCSGGHPARECPLSVEDRPTCANCRGAHTASSTECPIYKTKVEALQQQNQQPPAQKQYKEAPIPTTNPWTRTKQTTPTGSTTTEHQQQNPPRQTTTITNQSTQSMTSPADFSNLMSELNTLNSIIDIGQTIQAVATLNRMLANITTPLQVIETMQTFVQTELPKFNILRSVP